MQLIPVFRVTFVAAIACALLMTWSGCKRNAGAAAGVPPLPLVRVEDVPAPRTTSVVVEPGGNLDSIAQQAYGHGRFAGFIEAYNGIANPERVAAGAEVKTPSLAAAFRDAAADPAYQPALCALAKACTDYYAVEPAYLQARRASGVREGLFAIPPDIQKRLVASADAIDAARAALSAVKPPQTVPNGAIGQFRQAAELIRVLARGSIDGYGYDYDMVGQRLGLGFTNAMIWTRAGHQ